VLQQLGRPHFCMCDFIFAIQSFLLFCILYWRSWPKAPWRTSKK
jgi:hypothetical protein